MPYISAYHSAAENWTMPTPDIVNKVTDSDSSSSAPLLERHYSLVPAFVCLLQHLSWPYHLP